MRCAHIRLMADYNRWMNSRLYQAAMQLPEADLTADRHAFFGSILGTLNHLAVGDTIWLQRFAAPPRSYIALEKARLLSVPSALDQQLFSDLPGLSRYRAELDAIIVEWTAEIDEVDLDLVLHYNNTKGLAFDKPFISLLMHFFNHQTHHRGQVTTLLSQAGVDIGVTDLLALIPDITS